MYSFYYPISLELKLMNSVHCHETARIEGIFEEIVHENLEKRVLSVLMAAKLADGLTVTLLRLYNELMVGQETAEEAVSRITRHTTLPEIIAAIREEFIRIGGKRAESPPVSRHDLLFNKIVALIQEKYTDPNISICYMADKLFLSESYFSHFFKSCSGESFRAYLENLRLSRARDLLLGTGKNIEEIARQVGYFNSASFGRAFKRATGISPSELRSISGRNN